MEAFFDSPETIRNKIKEFRTTTFGGVNKQDVMNYLSVLAEQQGVMIKLLRENNIPLFVDEGYDSEEEFIKSNILHDSYMSGIDEVNSGALSNQELLAQIEALTAENNELRIATYSVGSNGNNITDFDSNFNINNSDNNEDLLKQIEEKDIYIQELESEVLTMSSGGSSSGSLNLLDEDDNDTSNKLGDAERATYKLQIEELTDKVNSLETSYNNNLFDNEITSNQEAIIEENKMKINTLSIQLEEANSKILAIDEVPNLKQTIEVLNSNIYALKEELDRAKNELEEVRNNDIVSNEFPDFKIDSDISSEKIEDLITKIEVLELEVSKKSKENSIIEVEMSRLKNDLSRYSVQKNENGIVINLSPEDIHSRFNELLKLEEKIKFEKENIDSKLMAISKKEAVIEENKHLISEDFVQNISSKEKEVERLHKQISKMLTIAEATAESTEQEAKANADKIMEEAEITAKSMVDEAISKKEEMLSEANANLSSSNIYKEKVEKDMEELKIGCRRDADDLILEAQSKAEEVLLRAKESAETIEEESQAKIDAIINEANDKVKEIEAQILVKQKEAENMQEYYQKVKENGIYAIKKLYDQLENIIYIAN